MLALLNDPLISMWEIRTQNLHVLVKERTQTWWVLIDQISDRSPTHQSAKTSILGTQYAFVCWFGIPIPNHNSIVSTVQVQLFPLLLSSTRSLWADACSAGITALVFFYFLCWAVQGWRSVEPLVLAWDIAAIVLLEPKQLLFHITNTVFLREKIGSKENKI